ncbi:PC-esterase domain-containing protein 1A isoform X3 [Notolabrus celidotus]|uniref:PC-esterase domain-containing protein 1A isoform X3 n=1 Tax=Notolabrus celidotus TaxID=1203425 RepID=UPI0014904427|nr:PC-esterase domain-containing protein 1A isoform X3 [Notolabrus celidotus]
MKTPITQSQARQLLHNKFVVVLGDSVQRAIYKDLVLLLQRDQYLSLNQLKTKGELSFEHDELVEGGRLVHMNNGTEYKEVRQYCTDHHLVRFYFLTRIFSGYMNSILKDFRRGPKPDVIIVSSCVWDISRYGSWGLQQYKENLHVFFREIKDIVPNDCLILWNLAMPLGKRIKGGFLVPEVSHMAPTLRNDVIEANFYSCMVADAYDSDVLDLHYHFRLSLQHRMPDGIHWDALAHRRISGLLLQHVADAWGVDLHDPASAPGQALQGHRDSESNRNRPERPRTRPLQDLVPLQRFFPIQYQQSNYFRSDRLPPPPPYSDYQPLGPSNRLRDQRDQRDQINYPPIQSRLGTGDYSFREDDRCMRRRRRRRQDRNHPYTYHPSYVAPRQPAHGCLDLQPQASGHPKVRRADAVSSSVRQLIFDPEI